MKTTRTALLLLALAGLVSGCSSDTPSAATPVRDREADIRSVIEMQRRGELDDTRALALVASMVGMPPAGEAAPARRAIVFAEATPATPAPVVEKTAPATRRPVVTGRLRSVGSDSMDRIMEDWTKSFAEKNPGLRVSHESKGSSTAIPALLEGRADFGPMSRPLKKEEIDEFAERFGYAPTQVRVALDTIAIYLNPANPLAKTGLTLKQLDAIFSSTRKRGGARVTTWGDLGLDGAWKDVPVRVYSRNGASGTYAFFREEVLLKGDFREDMTTLAGSAELVSAVASDKYAIGYSGIGYRTADVAVAPVASRKGEKYQEPDEANAVSGAYPISRALYLTLNRRPDRPASELQKEFLRHVLGSEGREVVKREGYFALPEKEVPGELAKIGL